MGKDIISGPVTFKMKLRESILASFILGPSVWLQITMGKSPCAESLIALGTWIGCARSSNVITVENLAI